MDLLLEPFARLNEEREARLVAFFARDDLVVKGIDRTPGAPYRGGCLPYFGLVAAAAMGWFGEGAGLDRPIAIGLALTLAVLSSNRMIRSYRAVRRSRRLLDEPDGWHGIAWTREAVGFRSLHKCLLAAWKDVVNIRLLDDEAGSLLAGTLWIHVEGGDKILIEPRTDDGHFAGRPIQEWFDDLAEIWGEQTGRRSTLPKRQLAKQGKS